MEYFKLGEIKINCCLKPYVDNVMAEVYDLTREIKIFSIETLEDKQKRLFEKYNLGGHAKVSYWQYDNTYHVMIDLIPIIKSWEDMYLLVHEVGHVINKHISDMDSIMPFVLEGTFEKEMDRRENEADEYVVKKFSGWVDKVGEKEQEELKNIIKQVRTIIQKRN